MVLWLSKILERVIYKRLCYFMNTSNTFYANQYGCRHRHSTLHDVTKLVTDIFKHNDNKESTLSILLDLSNAFDTLTMPYCLQNLNFMVSEELPSIGSKVIYTITSNM